MFALISYRFSQIKIMVVALNQYSFFIALLLKLRLKAERVETCVSQVL